MRESRREFLRTGLLGGAAFIAAFPEAVAGSFRSTYPADDSDPWAQLPRILARIKPPTFPHRDFDITRFGAKGDGKTDCSEALQKAIAQCNTAGGGRVLVPAGSFLSGPIHLKSNVNLHLASDAIIKFSRDPARYLPVVFTRFEGMELMNYSPFIYAFEQQNIAITGNGTLDGQSDHEHWWSWKGRANFGWKPGDSDQNKARNALVEMVAKDTPVSQRIFGEGSYLRPQFIQPYRCQNVLIEGVTLRGSPMWQVHPALCTNVTVQRLTIIADGPNTDGCDPESSKDVLIKDCQFSTGDDCIAVKSGRNNDGRRVPVPCENIVIQGCTMKDGHGAITVGSEISAGVRNLFAENCTLDSPHLNQALRFKNNAVRGGLLEKFYFRNMRVGQVADAVLSVDFYYEEGEQGQFTPVVRDVLIDHLTSGKSKRALDLRGYKNAPIASVRLENCIFENVADSNILENVSGLSLRNVTLNGRPWNT